MYRRSSSAVIKDGIRQNSHMQGIDDQERFSSFQSLSPSDHANQQFSDFQTSRERAKDQNQSLKKQKSHILVQQLPVQYDSLSSYRKHQQQGSIMVRNGGDRHSPQVKQRIAVSSNVRGESGKTKQNGHLKYNYMQRVDKHLSTITQDYKEDMRDSAFTSVHLNKPYPFTNVAPFDPIWNNKDMFIRDPNIVLLQKQRMQMLMLEQENITLRERVFILQKQLRIRDEEQIRKEREVVQRISINFQKDQTTHRQAKLKLVEQVAVLQTRCREMKEEMRLHKEKQEQTLLKLTQEKDEALLEVLRVKTAQEYQQKFTEVFLNMVEKLPVDLQESWSKKRKIAVGWRVVKHLVKKAFKLGIHPPAVLNKND